MLAASPLPAGPAGGPPPPGSVADAILEGMRRWYEEGLDGEDASVARKQVQQCLFRLATVLLQADMWRNPNLGVAQPEDESEGQAMAASEEHVARQAREAIARREKWLARNGLPRSTRMNGEHNTVFLKAPKEEHHRRPDQRERPQRDAIQGLRD